MSDQPIAPTSEPVAARGLTRLALRDPVLHEVLTAAMWLRHGLAALHEAMAAEDATVRAHRLDLVAHFGDLAQESVFKACRFADEAAAAGVEERPPNG